MKILLTMNTTELRERSKSPHQATLLYLIASGLKAGGEFEILPFKNEVELISDTAKKLDLSFYIHQMRVPLKVPLERLEGVRSHLEKDHLSHTVQELSNNLYRIIIPNCPGRILFWKNEPRINPQLAISLYDAGISYIPLAVFLGYPECCILNFRGERSVRKFNTALRERYLSTGIKGIEHLIGLFHVPCNIDCAETKKLGYSAFLKKSAPELYEEMSDYELAKATGNVKFIQPTPDIDPFTL